MKKILFLVPLIMHHLIYSQVGINTSNPQTAFHIDGAKNNPTSGIPGLSQQNDDFAFTSSGNVGVGIISPTQKLDINGNARIRTLADGNNMVTYPRQVVAQADGTLGYRTEEVSIAKQVYVSNEAVAANTLTIDKFEFRLRNEGGLAVPEFRLTSNPGSSVSIFFHIEERWNNGENSLNGGNGQYSFITLENSPAVNATNWNSWHAFSGVANGISRQVRNMNEFSSSTISIQFGSDPTVYIVDFKIIDIPFSPETYSIIAHKY